MKPGVLRLFPPLLAVALWSGCASSAPPLPPSLNLPTPVRDLRAVRKGNRVSLTWTVPTQTTDHESIRRYGPTRVCRSMERIMAACGTPIATMPPARPKSVKGATAQNATLSYTDTLARSPGVRPADEAAYAVEVLNQAGRSAGLSNQVHVPVFPALPPPSIHVEVTAEGVKITWPCPEGLPQLPGVRYRIRASRAPAGSEENRVVGESDLADCSAPLLDPTFEWEKTYDYHAAALILVSQPGRAPIEIEGDDSPSVRVFVHDVFPPAVPSGLQAVFSGVGQQPFIDLSWTPDSDVDLAGYNVYRHEEGSPPVKINAELVKVPAYRDSAVQAGKRYFYAVSALDVRGNESARSEQANEVVP